MIGILSIDSNTFLEVNKIKLGVQSKKTEVNDFLEELRSILNKANFDIDTDIILIRAKKKKEDEQYSTPYTLLDLDYDTYDVIDRLKELTIKDYSETLIDRDDINPPLLFVFGKDINNKQVYVKLKIEYSVASEPLNPLQRAIYSER